MCDSTEEVTREVEAQRELNVRLGEKCLEDEELQADCLQEKQYELEEEQAKAQPIRNSLIELKGNSCWALAQRLLDLFFPDVFS